MKKGFTLAETLVALAVMGVLAGIMFPVINNVRPNNEMVMFKKSYYLAARTISELVNDETLYPEAENPDIVGLQNTESVPYRGRNYEGPTKFRDLLAAKMNTEVNDDGSFTTSDGMVWRVNFNNGNNITIDVDVDRRNGCSDTDNDCNNPDEFEITVLPDGRTAPSGRFAPLYLAEKNNSKKAQDFLKGGCLSSIGANNGGSGKASAAANIINSVSGSSVSSNIGISGGSGH